METLSSFRRQYPLLFNLLLIAAIMLALALAAHVVMQIGTRHGSRRTVPDFSGVQLLEAQRLARKNDLKLQINDSLFVPVYEGGIVLDQLPKGGVEVKPGRTVYLTINSFRQKMVPVPFVADRSLRQAKNMLEIAGLEIGQLVYRTDMATNYVLDEYLGRQRITETTRVEAEMGSGVTLYVGVQPGHNVTVVPQVIGLSLKDAKSRLWELGLNVGKVAFDPGINLLNQKDAYVYMQSPRAERRVALGTKVDLQLTLDMQKTASRRKEAEEQADEAFRERQRLDGESAARQETERPQSAPETNNGFFD
ncbi:MAG: PASTA domain-containing protein [Alistipes sp.]|nr:PASTA domain-containing protein [Alistipes sp.]